MKLQARPMSIAEANLFIKEWHRHCAPLLIGGRFAIGAWYGDTLAGVAIVGNPSARCFMGAGIGEVRRLCVRTVAPKGSCSFLYAACWREWQKRVFGKKKVRGWRLYTYTLQSESGASLRGAGWRVDAEIRGQRGWNTPARPRINQEISQVPKMRWIKELPLTLPLNQLYTCGGTVTAPERML